MKLILAIAIGGAAGAVSRHFLTASIMRLLGSGFPYGIFVVNVVGSFLMGLLVTLLATRFEVSPELRGLLAVGFLGSFTTFSTYSLDIMLMIERGEWGSAAIYAFGSLVLGVLGLIGGMMIGKIFV